MRRIIPILLLAIATSCAGKLGGDLAVGPQSKPPATRDLAVTGATLKLEISGLTSADLVRFGLALTPDGRFAPVVVPLAATGSAVPAAPAAPLDLTLIPRPVPPGPKEGK